jgi:hypothetical protein
MFPYALAPAELAWLVVFLVITIAAFVVIFNLTTAQDLKK